MKPTWLRSGKLKMKMEGLRMFRDRKIKKGKEGGITHSFSLCILQLNKKLCEILHWCGNNSLCHSVAYKMFHKLYNLKGCIKAHLPWILNNVHWKGKYKNMKYGISCRFESRIRCCLNSKSLIRSSRQSYRWSNISLLNLH